MIIKAEVIRIATFLLAVAALFSACRSTGDNQRLNNTVYEGRPVEVLPPDGGTQPPPPPTTRQQPPPTSTPPVVEREREIAPAPAPTAASTPRATPRVAVNNATPEYPVAKAVPGKPGFVFSPFESNGTMIDVTGYASGTKVKDPGTNKIFIVP